MYAVLLNSESPLLLELATDDDVNLVWLRNNSFVVCIIPEIVFRLHPNLKRVIIYTGFENLVKDAMIEYSNMSESYSVKENSELIALRSYLNYFTYENVAPEGFYWKLLNILNDEKTHDRMYYEMQYRTYPIYVEQSNTFFEFEINITTGPMIACSSEFKRENIPHFYIKELFRDIVELELQRGETKEDDHQHTNDITNALTNYTLDDFSSLILIEGETTKELYLYYPKLTEITQESNEALSEMINSRLDILIRMRIFPRSTKVDQKTISVERTRDISFYLKPMSNGQFRLKDEIEKDLATSALSPYNFTFDLFVDFSSLANLNLFLNRARDYKPLTFMIYIERNDFVYVKYFTASLENALIAERLFSLAKDLTPKEPVALEIVSSDNRGIEGEFYNSANGQYMRFIPVQSISS